MYGEELPAKTLFDMVTINAARALGLEGRAAQLEPGAWADAAVFRAKADDPYESLALADCEDLELLTIEGVPVYGDEAKYGEAFEAIAGARWRGYGRVDVGGRTMFVKGDPAGLYRERRVARSASRRSWIISPSSRRDERSNVACRGLAIRRPRGLH